MNSMLFWLSISGISNLISQKSGNHYRAIDLKPFIRQFSREMIGFEKSAV